MSNTLLFLNASEIIDGSGGVLQGHALATRSGRIIDIGPQTDLRVRHAGERTVDCKGQVLTPGFVDSHTHALFGGWRAAEYEMRSAGLDYMEIARRGGGINASVRDVRAQSESDLLEFGLARAAMALRHGTTTLEIKSGYGLSVADELKMLRVIAQLSKYTVLDIVPTFLGAHDVPLDYRDRRND